MDKKPRVFVSDERKAKAIEQIEGGRDREDIALELDVSIHTVNLWMAKRHRERQQASLAAPQAPSEPSGNDSDLKRQVELLQLEVEYLKKRLALYE